MVWVHLDTFNLTKENMVTLHGSCLKLGSQWRNYFDDFQFSIKAILNFNMNCRYNQEYRDNASEIGSGESKLAKPVVETQQTEIMEEPTASTSGHKKHVRVRAVVLSNLKLHNKNNFFYNFRKMSIYVDWLLEYF